MCYSLSGHARAAHHPANSGRSFSRYSRIIPPGDFVLPVGLFALIAGYLHHHTRTVLISGCAGLGLLLLAALFGHDYLGETGEISLTVAASIMIAVAHIRNFQLRPRSSR